MEKYFVNYNQSLALKKLGFKENCLARFFKVGDEKEIFMYFNTPSNENTGVTIIAPLKSQVFEWFRTKHRLEPNIIFREYYYENGDKNVYDVNIESNIDSDFCLNITPLEGFKTYEEAESACIDELIKIVKDGKK